MRASTIAALAALTVGALCARSAHAVTGVGLNSDGTLLLSADQVVECPRESGDGDYQRSWPSTGKKMEKGKCKGGLYVGTWKAWHENGEKMWEVSFDAGRPNGELHSWWPNGQDHAKAQYANGLLDGKYKGWHQSGKVSAEGSYRGGKRAGCWETSFDSGEHESKGDYNDGNKVKTWLFWDRQGHKRKEKYGGQATEGGCMILL
jgi:antitoxin component YwqK of YwqJK toxin-antitoxin module